METATRFTRQPTLKRRKINVKPAIDKTKKKLYNFRNQE